MKKLFLLILSVTYLPLLPAQEKDDKPLMTLEKKSEQVFITATKTQRKASTLPAPVTVISREDIEKSTAQTLPDLFKHLSGIDVKERFGNITSTAIDIRGFGEVAAANTLVLVDGRRLNRSDLAAPDFTAVPLNRIDHIEVYRGGRSVLYGDNATGGVINIITKKDTPDGHTLRLQSEFGSYETFRFGMSLDGKVGNTIYSLDSSYYDTNGFRDNNHERIKSAGFSVLIQEYDNWDLAVSGGLSQNDIGSPGRRPANSDRTAANSDTDYTEYRERYVNISPRYWFTDDVNLELTLTRREGDFDSVISGNKRDRFQIVDTGISPKLTVNSRFDGISNTFITGFDWTHSKSTFRQERNRRSFGYYVYNATGFLDDTLYLDLGYRAERTRINVNGTSKDFTPENMEAYTFGLTWNYQPGSKVYFSYDRSFRFQRVDELGGTSFDEPLEPQETTTWQAGFRHRFNRYVTFAANYFVINTDHEIFFDSSAGTFGLNSSYGHTSREGFELELLLNPTEDLQIFANYTKMDGRLLNDQLTQSINYGNDIPEVPEQRANLGFSLDFLKNFNWTVAGRWADRYIIGSDFDNNSDKDDGYITVDTKLTFTWKWLQLYGGCNNLFDETYNSNQTTFGIFPAPGREFFGGVNLTFEF